MRHLTVAFCTATPDLHQASYCAGMGGGSVGTEELQEILGLYADGLVQHVGRCSHRAHVSVLFVNTFLASVNSL